jgi:hypothetical protein
MNKKNLALAGFGLFTFITLGVIPAETALGQTTADYDRLLCQRAPFNSLAAMLVSRRGVDCTRYGMSPQMNQGIHSEQNRNYTILNCAAYGGRWRNDIGMCMPTTELGCKRQRMNWDPLYKECFPPPIRY